MAGSTFLVRVQLRLPPPPYSDATTTERYNSTTQSHVTQAHVTHLHETHRLWTRTVWRYVV